LRNISFSIFHKVKLWRSNWVPFCVTGVCLAGRYIAWYQKFVKFADMNVDLRSLWTQPGSELTTQNGKHWSIVFRGNTTSRKFKWQLSERMKKNDHKTFFYLQYTLHTPWRWQSHEYQLKISEIELVHLETGGNSAQKFGHSIIGIPLNHMNIQMVGGRVVV